MSGDKRISVVTVCFNAAETIADTLASVAAQRGVNIEHIIIDGGSSDGTMDIVARFPHVAVVVSEPDDGLYNAMNKGLSHATGDLVGFLNADDFLCQSDAIASIARAFAETGADAVIAGVAVVDQDKTDVIRRYYSVRHYGLWMMKHGHMPPHPTFYAKPELLRDMRGFDESYKIAGDFDIILRIMRRRSLKISRIDRALVGFREGGVSGCKKTLTREIARSLRDAGYSASHLRSLSRYLLKIPQLLRRPSGFTGARLAAPSIGPDGEVNHVKGV